MPGKLGCTFYGKVDGMYSCILSLCEQDTSYPYEIHFNIPETYNITGEQYVIPEWLTELCDTYPHLKIFRVVDSGPSTKIIPTLQRVTDPEAIIIVLDDDQVYHPKMVEEHVQHQLEEEWRVCAYDGLDAVPTEGLPWPVFSDARNHFVASITFDCPVNIVQHYKSVSYKRKYFEDDFFTEFATKTTSDDIACSAYMNKRKIKKVVMTYEGEPRLETYDEWRLRGGVVTFPIMKSTSVNGGLGCNEPALGQKFFIPPEFISPVKYI